MSIRFLDRLLEPTSIVVIGASSRSGSVGATVWQNLRAAGFAGPLHAVNLRGQVLDGQPLFAHLADLPGPADLAVLCTPPASVAGLIDELGQLGTRAAIVMTGGMSAAQKLATQAAARPHLLRVLGPNCLGLLTPRLGLNASFAHTNALDGQIAFVSQSGAIVTAVLDWAKTRQLGFSHMVSLGEHLDVDFGDLLDHLASDPHTRAILLYIESIESPRKFISAARAAARNKPVIVVKAGRAGHGVAAAASHTGALAGSDAVVDAVIRRTGMLRVDTLQDLFMAAETLAHMSRHRDDALTVMTNGGGAGVLAADAAALAGVPLRELSPGVRAELDRVLPATWSRANPIDIIGDAPIERYTATLQTLLADGNTGAVLFLHAPTAIVRSADIARACAPLVAQAPGRVMACWLGDDAVVEARRILRDAGAADYATPEEAVRAFALLETYRRNQTLLMETPTSSESAAPDLPAARAIIDAVLAGGREMLDEVESKALLSAYRIPVLAAQAVSATPRAAVDAARAIGYPVALKILSPDITHKSDVGGVCLNLRGDDELSRAASEMLARVRSAQPTARIAGFTVQPMASRPHAQELIVGASIDPVFGPVLLFGHGGTAVEVIADRAMALPPLNRVLARALISRTRVAKLLAGYRDHPPAQLDAIGDTLIALSQMLADLPELAELDINPLLADHQGVLALDARVRISRSLPAGAAHFAITPYPAHLARTLSWHGAQIVIRPIRPEDEPQHARFMAEMQANDLRLRFFNVRGALPHSELARLTQIDYSREMAFIATLQVDGSQADGSQGDGSQGDGRQPQTLGVARAVADPDNIDAEFAVIVRSDLKHRGLGRLLMQTLIDYQAQRGTKHMVGLVLHENTGMRALAHALGFVQDDAGSDHDAVRVVLALSHDG